jgi:hypothetical protein
LRADHRRVNTLADYTRISRTSAVVNAPSDFNGQNECTVTYTSRGLWEVSPGQPEENVLSATIDFSNPDLYLELAAISYLGHAIQQGNKEVAKIKSVAWNGDEQDASVRLTYLTGILTVNTVLTAAFIAFTLSGIRFSIDQDPQSGFKVHFSYSGNRSADFIKSLFQAGATLFLTT